LGRIWIFLINSFNFGLKKIRLLRTTFMKKLHTILVVLLITATTFAQAPEKMSYQAVVRDASGALVTNQAVGMQISILQGSASGTAVY
jgi:hypothetical protein